MLERQDEKVFFFEDQNRTVKSSPQNQHEYIPFNKVAHQARTLKKPVGLALGCV